MREFTNLFYGEASESSPKRNVIAKFAGDRTLSLAEVIRLCQGDGVTSRFPLELITHRCLTYPVVAAPWADLFSFTDWAEGREWDAGKVEAAPA